MDIIVTVPKSEKKNIALEDKFVEQNKDNAVQAWHVGRVPKNLKSGDRVYFVEDGAVRYYHEFLRMEENFRCEVTGRVWSGLNLILKCPETKLALPIPMKGFQGFRYTVTLKDGMTRVRV